MEGMKSEIVCASFPRSHWLAERRKGIGSSDAAALLGLSPWASPLSVYAEKVSEVPEDEEATEAQRWGTILEPVILDEFAKEMDRKVHPGGALLRSLERPWQLCTLDGWQDPIPEKDGPGVLEIKATGFRSGDWQDGVPDPVYAQFQHQLDVTGYLWGSVAVLFRGCQLRRVDIDRDDAFIALMREAEAEFWARVQARVPVHPDGSAATKAALRQLYPRDNGETVVLPGSMVELDEERLVIKASMKLAKLRLDTIENEIRAAIGPATTGVMANGVAFTNKTQKRAGYSVKATEFRKLHRIGDKSDE